MQKHAYLLLFTTWLKRDLNIRQSPPESPALPYELSRPILTYKVRGGG